MVFDRSSRGPGPLPGLSTIWASGARLYRWRGFLDASIAARSWDEALSFLAGFEPERPIAEIQFWGHGKWGDASIGEERFDERRLLRSDPLAPALAAIKKRLQSPEALFWFRTCETLGAARGQSFAVALAESLGCRVAGHTFVISYWQSGLHVLGPGEQPTWDPAEGLIAGTPDAPQRARHSLPYAPNTITCWASSIPEDFR
jgi:hypothetical protein